MTWSITAMLCRALQGAFGMLEHPADPESYGPSTGEHPSIWNTAALQWMEQTGLFHFEFLNQGHYGGLSPKPTNVMFCGVPGGWIHDLAVAFRSTALPKCAAIGKDSTGTTWLTSPLKEYPAQMCKWISRIYQLWITRRIWPSWRRDKTWLKEYLIRGSWQ